MKCYLQDAAEAKCCKKAEFQTIDSEAEVDNHRNYGRRIDGPCGCSVSRKVQIVNIFT